MTVIATFLFVDRNRNVLICGP